MQLSHEQVHQNWWAEGDTPVRTDSRVLYLVDGRSAMLEICRHCLKAQKYIYLANWGMTPLLELVRGKDHRRGPDGSPEQEELLAELRAEGLQEADIAFWQQNALSVRNVLAYARSKGVEVKVLLWKCSDVLSHYSPKEAHEQLTSAGVTCLLDDSAQGVLHHPIESLHQKLSVIDGQAAFVGGVDPLIEKEGEFDRWDLPDHPFTTPLRQTAKGATPHPWHDAHSLIEGPAASDVELNFRQRWNDVVTRHHLSEDLLVPEHPIAPPLKSQSLVQVARTIPEHTYKFITTQGIAQLYHHALNNIQRFVYLENQYFWLRAFYGIDIPFAGTESYEMQQNVQALIKALQRGAFASIILPDHPNVGRGFSDAGLMRIREGAPQANDEGRFEAFCLATSTQEGGRTHYRPIYVHAKVAVVDDLWSTVGSGNLNNRGMRDDTEINVATLDPTATRGLRLMLQGEHLGIVHTEELLALSRLLGQQHQSALEEARARNALRYLEETLGDPARALTLMHDAAWRNLNLYKQGQPLVGHLLPYLSAEEAQQQGLHFREEHGWVEEEEKKIS
ncbi:phospholipase D-like domain-containing protein [Tengunoibacter tsumagoiensis]|uniref:Phospholipase n=1 Tax=Tengunoibacter tsumagoiensis TaxID=2014871 RepID=A0A402A3S8_9CHLR|nr:phospholipase D family protein [Tengunoibacter tsumagoiensis]GCE13732.1 phospholipase [Tengunoibacter tsumagoiensis]